MPASVSSFTMSDFSEASITTDAAIRRHRHEPGVSPCTARSVQRGTYYDLNNDNDNNNNNNAKNGQGPSLLHSSMNSLAQQQQQQQISHRIDMTGTVISSASSSSRGTTISIHADEQEGDIENNIQSILNHDNDEQAFSNHNGNRHRNNNNNTTRRHPLAVPPEIQQKIHERRQGELKLFFFIFVISSLGVLVVTLYDIINPK